MPVNRQHGPAGLGLLGRASRKDHRDTARPAGFLVLESAASLGLHWEAGTHSFASETGEIGSGGHFLLCLSVWTLSLACECSGLRVSVSSAPPERGTNPKPSSSECCRLCSQPPIRIPVTLTFPLGFRAAPQAAHAGGGWSLRLRVGGGTASGARPCPTAPWLPLGSSGPSRHWPGRQLVPSYGRQQYLHLRVHLAVRSKLIY